jgi:RNA polymerase sigma-54 factor
MRSERYRLQYRHELRHFILPTLTHYLKLIELPNLELETFIRQELETNPLLEESPPEESSSETEEQSETPEDEKSGEESKETNEFDVLELFAEEQTITYRDRREEEFNLLDNVPAQGEKLYDYLMKQASRKFAGQDLEIAELIISNIEDDGHLAAASEELAKEGFEIADVTRIIKEVQHFDPAGCAWRDVKEPLLAQLEILGYSEDSVEQILVRDYLKDLRSNRRKEIMKALHIDEEKYLKAVDIILKLDPKPGWRYSRTPSRYVSPDFIVRWSDNKLVAHLKDEFMPRVRVRKQYLEILKNPKGVPKEQLTFIKQRCQAAQNMVIAIEQRRKTLKRVIEGILEYQHDFFENGYNHLKSITMTEFARQLNVNPSTISRAIANKYLESPWGIHKLKFFFTAAVGQTDKHLILNKIKEIVEKEDKSSPLSDTQIARKLSRQGIIISRRTVSKYRDLLKIPAHQYRRT